MSSCNLCGSQLERPNFGQHADNPRQALESEISWVEARLGQLIQEHRSLRKALNNRFCPVLQLPPEISTKIFIYYLRVGSTTPFQLGHICRTWRDLVWSTSMLWKNVSLNLQHHFNCDLIQKWLVHSGRHPLDIKITWDLGHTADRGWQEKQDREEEIVVRLEHVMDVLIRVSDRWHAIDICNSGLYFYNTGPTTLNALQRPLPLLTSASLGYLKISDWGILHFAMELDQICLTSCDLPNVPFPSQKLTRISLACTSTSGCLMILANAPSLKHCTMTNCKRWRVTSLPTENPATATSSTMTVYLESLTINSDELGSISDLVDHLTTPRLRELVIYFNCSAFSLESKFPFSSVISLTARSACTLYHLSLSSRGIQESTGLFGCLRMMPSVVELHLSSTSLRNEYVSLLAPYPMSDVNLSDYLLPRLQLLVYDGHLDIHLVDINTILLARWKSGAKGEVAPLKQVYLRNIPDSSIPPALPQHPQRVAEGMFLYLETSSVRGYRQ